jgi:hypothetical protein
VSIDFGVRLAGAAVRADVAAQYACRCEIKGLAVRGRENCHCDRKDFHASARWARRVPA